MKKAEKSFEVLLEELEERTRNLEHGTMTLEEALKTYEEAMGLLQECRIRLAGAENQLLLLKEEQGRFIARSVNEGED